MGSVNRPLSNIGKGSVAVHKVGLAKERCHCGVFTITVFVAHCGVGSNGLSFAERANLLRFEPLLQTIGVVEVSTFEADAVCAEGDGFLANRALFRGDAESALEGAELFLGEPLRHSADPLAELQQLFVAHLVDVDAVILAAQLLPELLYQLSVVRPQLLHQRQHFSALPTLLQTHLHLVELVHLLRLPLPQRRHCLHQFRHALPVSVHPLRP